jgi:modulator of FtsH protease HflC
VAAGADRRGSKVKAGRGSTPATSGISARSRLLLLLTGALLLVAIYGALFTVDVTRYGVVSRFGHIVRVVDAPGLHLKLPFDRIVSVDRRLLYSRPAQAEYLTSDKKNVVVRSLALWRIADPKRFLETVRSRAEAEIQLADVVLAEIGAALGNYPFASFVSAGQGESRFDALVDQVRSAVQAYALPGFGIEVVDLDVRQLYLPEANKQSVFERMKAERGKIAKQFRSEGERDSTRMIAEADREKTRIAAEAYATAARTKAEGDAQAMRIYADAFARDPAFYKFLRTLQAYETVLDDKTTLFLPADAEIFAILQDNGVVVEQPAIEPESPVAGSGERPAVARDERPRAEASDGRPESPAPEVVP